MLYLSKQAGKWAVPGSRVTESGCVCTERGCYRKVTAKQGGTAKSEFVRTSRPCRAEGAFFMPSASIYHRRKEEETMPAPRKPTPKHSAFRRVKPLTSEQARVPGYDFAAIEAKWRARWEEQRLYQVDLKAAPRPYYNLMMFPYPSAEGLHVGTCTRLSARTFTGAGCPCEATMFLSQLASTPLVSTAKTSRSNAACIRASSQRTTLSTFASN